MLEVVQWDPKGREAIVMSGFGPRSGWFLNVRAGGAEDVRIGARRFRPTVRHLEPEEAAAVLAGYERRNRLLAPLVRRVLARLAGFPYDGSPGARRQLVEKLPLIGFGEAPGSGV